MAATGPHPDRKRRSRRRHPRVGVPTTAILFANRRPVGPGLVEDLSAGGLRVVLGSAIRLGRMVSVLLDLPGKEPFLGLAQVARHHERAPDEHMLALSFLQLGRAEVERLEALIAGRLAGLHPCLEFFDTDDDGRPRRLVLTDDTPLVG
jgi:PilZ domain-containing protein